MLKVQFYLFFSWIICIFGVGKQPWGVWTVVLYIYTAIVKLMLKLKNNLHISDFFRILQALSNKTRRLWLHSLLFAYACVWLTKPSRNTVTCKPWLTSGKRWRNKYGCFSKYDSVIGNSYRQAQGCFHFPWGLQNLGRRINKSSIKVLSRRTWLREKIDTR